MAINAAICLKPPTFRRPVLIAINAAIYPKTIHFQEV